MNLQRKIEHRHLVAQERVERARRLEGVAWVATGSWIAGWASVLLLGYCVPSIPPISDYGLNEIGDWVAGAVAVPVLVWLVVTYKQQAAALELNSADLALSVQEMKEQAAATRSLSDQHQRELEPAVSAECTWVEADDGSKEIVLEVLNAGRLAIRSAVLCDIGRETKKQPKYEDLWPSGSTKTFRATIYEDRDETTNDTYQRSRMVLFCNEKGANPYAFILFLVFRNGLKTEERSTRVGVIEVDYKQAATELVESGWDLGRALNAKKS